LKSLFINKENAIMLCTIHKSKGLEADIVYILNEDLIPSRFAKSAEQLKQENNLKYVARTRAKEELYFLDL
jgi:superfamily I DNA/RNA helicase